MTKDKKIKIFLTIIESYFDDMSEEIEESNCISFYHFLLNALEFEYRFSSEEHLKSNLKQTINWLSNFDNSKALPGYINYKDQIIQIYIKTKEEFFIP